VGFEVGGVVNILAQNGLFASADYNAIGDYRVHLIPIVGLTGALQIIPVGTVNVPVTGSVITLTSGFMAGHGVINVLVVEGDGAPTDQNFALDVSLLGL
jgi:hypothetical protein